MLGVLGEVVIDFIGNILIFALSLILCIVAVILDVIINTFSFLLETDFVSKVYEALPVLSQADNVLTFMGVAIAIILLLIMIFHMGLAPVLSSGKNVAYPSMVVIRTMLVIPLVICAESISIYLSNLFTTFYSVMSSAFSAQIGGYTSDSSPFYLTGALVKFSGYSLTNIISPEYSSAIEESLGFTDGLMDTISSAVATILIFVLVILVGWNLIQFFLELFERFATMFFIMKVSPLCLATAIYPSTESIAKSWIRFFVGQFSLWVLQIMCVGWILGCLGSPEMFSDTFANSNGRLTGVLAWAGISYGLINMSRHVDDYINKLGLTAATTGSDFFRDISSITNTIGTAQKGFSAAKAGAIGLGKGISAVGRKFTASAPSQAYKEAYDKSMADSKSLGGPNPIMARAKAHAEGVKAFGRGIAEEFINSKAATCMAAIAGPNAVSHLNAAREVIKGRKEMEAMTGAHMASQKANALDQAAKDNLLPRAERYDETVSQKVVGREGNRVGVETDYSIGGEGGPVVTEAKMFSADQSEDGSCSNLNAEMDYVHEQIEVGNGTLPAYGTDSDGHTFVNFNLNGQAMRTVENGNMYETYACDKSGKPAGSPVHVMQKSDIPLSEDTTEKTALSKASLESARALSKEGFGKRHQKRSKPPKDE